MAHHWAQLNWFKIGKKSSTNQWKKKKPRRQQQPFSIYEKKNTQ